LPDAELIERPRAWITRHEPSHALDKCCDAARRMSDQVTLHALAGMTGKFVNVKLLDGSLVDQLGIYPDRATAESRKTHPAQISVLVPPGGIRPSECEEILHYHREVYDRAGSRPLEIGYLQPLTRRDQRRQIRAFTRR